MLSLPPACVYAVLFSVTEQHLVGEDVLRHPDAPVRVEDGVRRPGGQHQRVPGPLKHREVSWRSGGGQLEVNRRSAGGQEEVCVTHLDEDPGRVPVPGPARGQQLGQHVLVPGQRRDLPSGLL